MILKNFNINKAFLLVIVALLSGNIIAQQKAQVSINKQSIVRQGDSLHIALNILANNVKLHSDQSLRLELALQNGDKQLVLPCIIYTGNKRYKYDRRSELLSGKPLFADKAVYKTIRPIHKNKQYAVDYVLTIPYRKWMDDASLNAVQLFHDCCNESPMATQTLLADINPATQQLVIPQPKPAVPLTAETNTLAPVAPQLPSPSPEWIPEPKVYTQMVSFLTPPIEDVKKRVASVSAMLNYPVNVYKVLPNYKNNPAELQKVDALMQSITGNEMISVEAIRITGYASPEGTYKSNELLAQRRAKGFADYVKNKYQIAKTPIHTTWIPEDWDGLVDLINEREMPYKQEVLKLIADTGIFDGREKKLMDLQGGVPYKEMLKDLFPSLRRIELNADYVVEKISDRKAKDLIYTRPELLSLDEMYRVALNYNIGSDQFREVYEIAAKQYPNDLIANNNAAAALLLQGKTKEAAVYLDKVKNNPMGLINQGVSAYIKGDMELAKSLFEQAKQNGFQAGDANLFLIQSTVK